MSKEAVAALLARTAKAAATGWYEKFQDRQPLRRNSSQPAVAWLKERARDVPQL